MIRSRLQGEIFDYFKNTLNADHYEQALKDIFNAKDDHCFEINYFIYFYNAKQKYSNQTATFNHATQPERLEVLKRYNIDNNFFKFRVSMNKLMRSSYYMGHPKTITGIL